MSSDQTAIALLYEACLEPARLREALEPLARHFESTSASYWTVAAEGGVAEFHGFGQDPAMQQAYAAHFHRLDPGVAIAAAAPTGRWFADRDTLDPTDPGQAEFVFDFCQPFGLGRIGGAKVLESSRGTTFLALQRPHGAPAYGTEGARRMALMFPHVQRAARIAVRISVLGQAERIAEAVLDQAQAATAVVTGSGHLVHANLAAQALFAGAAPLRLHADRLVAAEAKLAGPWRAMLAKACATPAQGSAASLVSARTGRTIQVQVAPISQRHRLARLRTEPLALVVAADSQAPPHRADVLRELFALTPAEARLLRALASGQSLQQVQARTGTSVSTLRTQLAAVFAKTGTSSQVQLVALTKTLPVLQD